MPIHHSEKGGMYCGSVLGARLKVAPSACARSRALDGVAHQARIAGHVERNQRLDARVAGVLELLVIGAVHVGFVGAQAGGAPAGFQDPLMQRISTAKTACTWNGHGKLIFIDIRDRYGITQVVFVPSVSPRGP